MPDITHNLHPSLKEGNFNSLNSLRDPEVGKFSGQEEQTA